MVWRAALYGRVSTDHCEQQESIKVQREALVKYAGEKGFEIQDYYFDEGYTGTDFNRPEIIRLKEDIARGKVNLILVKDLSRIGRNNSLTLLFIDYVLENGARLIAVNDCYDTLKDEDGLVGIKTWINERYSRDLSKKIKFALSHKKSKGEYLTPFAPYGYKKSQSVKNKLEIDPYAADVVREIFRLYISGLGFTKIANILQSRGILNPSRYGSYGRKSDRWQWTTIKSIISNPVYMGDSVQQKFKKTSFKKKLAIKAPSCEWIVVEGTHEAIISRDTFQIAQSILQKRKKELKYRNGPYKPHLFSSFLFCRECGHSMYFTKDKKGGGGYRCGNYVKYGRKYCSSHYISEESLVEALRYEIQSLIKANINFEILLEDVIKELGIREGNLYDKLNLLKREEDRNKHKLEMLYKDRLNGIISGEFYLKLKEEIDEIVKRIKKQADEISEVLESKENYRNRIREIYEFNFNIEREDLEWFLRRIDVSETGELAIEFNFFVP